MGKTVLIDLALAKTPSVYYGGDTVEGKVNVLFSEATNVQAIYLTFLGRAKVHYKVNKGDTSISYRSEEIYFNRVLFLFGSRRKASQEHPAGRHSYTFTYFLPPNLPSSFGGHYGYVTYLITGIIDRGGWHTDLVKEKPITILSHYDLNPISYNISSPAEGYKEETVNCCCFVSGELSAKFVINKRGFVPGEYAIFSAGVHNQSNTSVGPCTIRLVQIVHYFGKSDALFSHGYSKAKDSEEEVLRMRRPMVPAGQKGLWNNMQMRIPSLPPSTLPHCENINIEYSIDFCVYNPWGCDIKLSTDIVIGTIPLSPLPQVPILRQPVQSSSNQQATQLPALPPPYDELPPTYEECMLSAGAIVDEQDGDSARNYPEFRPLYQTYNFPAPRNASSPSHPEEPPPSYAFATEPMQQIEAPCLPTEQVVSLTPETIAPECQNDVHEADTQI